MGQSMNLDEFILLVNNLKHQPIILLEGKRKVKDGDLDKLVEIGRILAQRLPHAIFRSGNAEGSDLAFTTGVCEIDPVRMQNILPTPQSRKKYIIQGTDTHHLGQVNEPHVEYLIQESQKASPKLHGMLEYFEKNKENSNRSTASSKYILRDTMKVIGDQENGLAKADFALFYVDEDDIYSGGTGHTLKVCEMHQIQAFTQNVWFGWLN
jgi:hypothetical protein